IWWGDVNRALDEQNFFGLRDKVVAYLNVQPVLYVVDAFAGADPAQRIGVRVITNRPYHALFAKTLFIEPNDDELETFEADALVLHAPALEAEPEEDGTRTGTFIALHPSRTEVLIGGTEYAGEIKKSIFTVMNDRLPLERISHALLEKRAGHPTSVVMLTADAFGVLPPIARLTHDQALFYFLSGFTAKLAGTEIGVTEPQPTFSTCFGAPFLPQPPSVY